SALTITAGKVDVNDKTGFALTAAYDPAKVAASQTSVNGVKTTTDNLATAMELDGAVYRFTTNALEQAPVGGGSGVDTPGTTTLLSRIASAITITAGKIDVAGKTGFSHTAAYHSAKIASSQSSVDAVKFSTDHLSSAMEADGAVYRFTTNALENAPAGGGGGTADWTATERNQIRHRLGIDGTATAPSTGTPSLAKPGDAMTLTSVYD